MSTLTSPAFLEMVRKSGLVDPARLEEWLHAQGQPLPEPPADVADRMLRDGLLTRLQVQYLLQGRWRGFIINGKYKLLDLLGSGGMGRVYLCEHVHLKVPVALKMLPSSKMNDREAVERFYREARAFASLSHPNLVRGHDVDTDGKTHFIVMEYVEGVDLQRLVERVGPLEPARAAEYIRQAALGLQHAHERGWVHRDIKPANLLVDRSGTVRVLDMGLARMLLDAKDNLTRQIDDNGILGTADYLAPEQSMDSHAVDIRADVYSLGCTLYFLLAGKPPFGHGTTTQKLVWHQLRPAEPIRNLRPDLPEGLAAVVGRMMAKRPEDRPQTPAEVAAALAPWCPAGPVLPSAAEMAAPTTIPANALTAERRPPSGVPLPPPLPAHDRATPSPGGTPTQRLATPSMGGSVAPAEPLPRNTPSTGQTLDAVALSSKTSIPGSSMSMMLRKKVGRRYVFAAVGLAVFIGLGFMAYLFWGSTDTSFLKPFDVDATEDEPVEVVTIRLASAAINFRTAKGGTKRVERIAHRSIRDAIAKARDGVRILILDDEIYENVEVGGDGAAAPSRITIEGKNAQHRPIWRGGREAKDRDKPILALNGVKNWTVKGVIFHGDGSCPEPVVVRGHCPGLNLTDVRIGSFQSAGLALHGCSGDADERIVATRLRVESPANPAAVAVLMDGGKSAGSETQYVAIRDGRLQGMAAAAVQVVGPASYIEVRQTRVYRFTEAFRFTPSAKQKDVSRLRVTLASNTINDVSTGLHFEALPGDEKDEEKNKIAITNNLFCRVPRILVIDDESISQARFKKLFRQLDDNVQDRMSGSGEGTVYLRMTTLDFPPLPTGEDDATFLHYPANSPLATAAAGKPVGVPPVTPPPGS